MRFAPGTRFGPYEIAAPLGSGGMGEVYRATDTRLGREVALKVVRSESHSQEASRRFLNEALLLSRLTHPNIATLYELDNANGVDFLVLELVHGRTLAERIARGPIPEREAAGLAEQAAAALEHAHEQGIIHQDLKPANLVVTAGGLLKVLDFGVARVFQWTSEAPTLAAANQGGGTPRYMAPEQLRGAETSAQTDIYALGTVLYEMLTGQRPFTGPTEAMVTDAILNAQPVPPSQRVAGLSSAVDRIVLQCMARAAAGRFASATALRAALRELLQAATAGVPPPGVPAMGATATGPGARRSLVVLPAQVFGAEADRFLGDTIASTLATCLSSAANFEVRLSPLQTDIERIEGGLTGAMRALPVELFLLAHVIPQEAQLTVQLQLIEKATQKVLWSQELEAARSELLGRLRGAARTLAGGSSGALPAAQPAANELPFQDALYRANAYMQHGAEGEFTAAAARLRGFAEGSYRTAEASAALALLYGSGLQRGLPAAEALPQVQRWAQRALAADARCARAWTALSTAESFETSGFGKQLEYALRAASLAPQDALTHLGVSAALAHSSLALTLAAARHVSELDPLDVSAAIHEGTLQALFGRRAEALNRIEHALALAPHLPLAVIAKAGILCLLDDYAAAGAWVDARVRPMAAQQGLPEGWARLFAAIVDFGTLGGAESKRYREARAFMVNCASGTEPIAYWQVLTQGVSALVARSGDHETALAILEARAAAGLHDPYDFFLLHRHFEALRPNPRFQAVAARSRGALVTTLAVLNRAHAQGELPGYLDEPRHRYAGLAEASAEAETEAER